MTKHSTSEKKQSQEVYLAECDKQGDLTKQANENAMKPNTAIWDDFFKTVASVSDDFMPTRAS